MQQLSLFDFGEEKPKETKKKDSPEKQEAASASSEELLTQETRIETVEAPEENETKLSPDFSTDFIVEELEERKTTDENPDSSAEMHDKEIISEVVHKDPEKEVAKEKIITRKRGRKSFKEIDKEVDLIEVPTDEELFQKQYYPISTVAKWFRVNTSLLRFWENQFKILKPKKNKKGDRFFRPEDVKNLKLIYYLLRQKKLTIDGANKHLKAHKQHSEENMQLINALNNFKNFLLELKANV